MYTISGEELPIATTNKRNICKDGGVNNTNISRGGWDGGRCNVYEIYMWRVGEEKHSKRNILCGAVHDYHENKKIISMIDSRIKHEKVGMEKGMMSLKSLGPGWRIEYSKHNIFCGIVHDYQETEK